MALSFVETEKQSFIIEQINKLIPKFMEREHQLSELGSFPYENINDLKDIGYTKLTLPKEFVVVRFLYMTSFYFKRNCGRLRSYCIIDWLASWYCERAGGKSFLE